MRIGAGFGKGLLQGMAAVREANELYKDGQARREREGMREQFSKIANAAPETSTGYTADQGAEMEKLAGQGYKVTFDQGQNSYVATNDAGDTKSFGMQGITDFMGRRTAGAMSSAQVDNAKMLAMADVIGKSDPMASLRMKKEVRESDYQAKRQVREEKGWAKEDSMEALDNKLGQEFEASLVGEDGKKRAPSASDYMRANQQRAFAYAQGGHMKEAQQAFKENLASAHVQIQLDSAERKQALGPAMAALSSGDYGAVADFYNRFVPSGAKVTGIEAGKDGGLVMQRTGMDGQPMSPLLAKDKREAMAMLQSLENPSALYQYSQDEFSNQLKLRAAVRDDKRLDESIRHNRFSEGMQAATNARANASAGRAAADHAEARKEKAELPGMREALYRETHPDATPAQINAVRRGLIDVPGTGKAKDEAYSYNPVEIQKSFGETATDPVSGKETVKRNVALEQKFQDFWADNQQIKNQDRALQEFKRQESKGRRAAEPPKITSKEDFDKLPAGQKYTDPNGEVRIKPGAAAAAPPPAPTPRTRPSTAPAPSQPRETEKFTPSANYGADGTPKPKAGPSDSARAEAANQIAAYEKQIVDLRNSDMSGGVKYLREQDLTAAIKKLQSEYSV